MSIISTLADSGDFQLTLNDLMFNARDVYHQFLGLLIAVASTSWKAVLLLFFGAQLASRWLQPHIVNATVALYVTAFKIYKLVPHSNIAVGVLPFFFVAFLFLRRSCQKRMKPFSAIDIKRVALAFCVVTCCFLLDLIRLIVGLFFFFFLSFVVRSYILSATEYRQLLNGIIGILPVWYSFLSLCVCEKEKQYSYDSVTLRRSCPAQEACCNELILCGNPVRGFHASRRTDDARENIVSIWRRSLSTWLNYWLGATLFDFMFHLSIGRFFIATGVPQLSTGFVFNQHGLASRGNVTLFPRTPASKFQNKAILDYILRNNAVLITFHDACYLFLLFSVMFSSYFQAFMTVPKCIPLTENSLGSWYFKLRPWNSLLLQSPASLTFDHHVVSTVQKPAHGLFSAAATECQYFWSRIFPKCVILCHLGCLLIPQSLLPAFTTLLCSLYPLAAAFEAIWRENGDGQFYWTTYFTLRVIIDALLRWCLKITFLKTYVPSFHLRLVLSAATVLSLCSQHIRLVRCLEKFALCPLPFSLPVSVTAASYIKRSDAVVVDTTANEEKHRNGFPHSVGTYTDRRLIDGLLLPSLLSSPARIKSADVAVASSVPLSCVSPHRSTSKVRSASCISPKRLSPTSKLNLQSSVSCSTDLRTMTEISKRRFRRLVRFEKVEDYSD